MQPCFCVLGGAWPGTQQIARSDRQAVIGCFGNEAENRKDKGATWMTAGELWLVGEYRQSMDELFS